MLFVIVRLSTSTLSTGSNHSEGLLHGNLFNACGHLEALSEAASGRFEDLNWAESERCLRVTGCALLVGTVGALYIELSSRFVNKNKLYTRGEKKKHVKHLLKNWKQKGRVKMQQRVSWEGKDWVGYFIMTIFYLSNPPLETTKNNY